MANLAAGLDLSGDDENTEEFYLPSCQGVILVCNAGTSRTYQLQYKIDEDNDVWVSVGQSAGSNNKIRWVSNLPAGTYRIQRSGGSTEDIVKKVFLRSTHVEGAPPIYN